MEHVANARSSAAQVVASLLSPKDADVAAYSYVPFFYSRMFEHPGSERKVSWQFYGLSEGDVTTVGDFAPKLLVRPVGEGGVATIKVVSGDDDHDHDDNSPLSLFLLFLFLSLSPPPSHLRPSGSTPAPSKASSSKAAPPMSLDCSSSWPLPSPRSMQPSLRPPPASRTPWATSRRWCEEGGQGARWKRPVVISVAMCTSTL